MKPRARNANGRRGRRSSRGTAKCDEEVGKNAGTNNRTQ